MVAHVAQRRACLLDPVDVIDDVHRVRRPALADAAPADPDIVTLPEHSKTLGRPVAERGYGMPSQYEQGLCRRESSGLTRVQAASVSFAPLQSLFGIDGYWRYFSAHFAPCLQNSHWPLSRRLRACVKVSTRRQARPADLLVDKGVTVPLAPVPGFDQVTTVPSGSELRACSSAL
jgi:hypothetical protein